MRTTIALALLPVGAVLVGCGSSSTAPNGNTNPTVTTYVGAVASPAATGSFKATITTPASGEVLAAAARASGSGPSGSLVGPLSGGGSSITITVTLLNGTTLTLTGTLSSGAFTVSDNASPPDMCTGTVANLLSATCSFLGNSNVPLVGVLALAGAEGALATYCGFETPSSTNTTPIASLFLGIAGTNSFLARVASSNNALSFYLDRTATSTTIADTLLASTIDFFSGTYTSGTATGSETTSGTSVGSWSAISPCTLTAATASQTAVAFTAAVSAAPGAQAVTVTPAAAGPITAVVGYPAAPAPQGSPTGWLAATVSGDTVILSVSAQTAATAAGAPLTATVNVYPQFANNAPLAIAVTYTVTSASQPLTITSPPTLPNGYFGSTYCCVNGYQLTATGGPTSNYAWAVSAGSGLPSWLSLSTSGVLSGVPPVGATTPVSFYLTVASNTSTAAQQFTINIYPVLLFSNDLLAFTMNQGGAIPAAQTINLTGRGGTVSGLATALSYGAGPTGWLQFGLSETTTPATITVLPSVGAQSLAAGNYTALISVSSSVPGSLPGVVTVTLTVGSNSSCAIIPSTLPNGTVSTYYQAIFTLTPACTSASDNVLDWNWSISAGAPPLGLSLEPLYATEGTDLVGTPSQAGPYTFTITFTNSDTVSGHNEASASQSFTVTIAP